ncbi:MAG: hypothetical protein ACLFWM_05635 [Actinomycetota bacterium]
MASLTTGRSGLRDVVVEAVNAKDPDLLALAEDLRFPPETIDALLDLMERWPRLMLSRGDLDGQPVAAVWVPDTEGAYGPGGHVEFYIEEATVRLALVPEAHPRLVSEAPPGLEVAEWEDIDLPGGNLA